MTTLSPKEFKLFVKTMSYEYEEQDDVKQDTTELKEICEDVKRENELLKMVVAKLTKENLQLHMKCKQQECKECKEGKKDKEQLKLDSIYFKKKLNL